MQSKMMTKSGSLLLDELKTYSSLVFLVSRVRKTYSQRKKNKQRCTSTYIISTSANFTLKQSHINFLTVPSCLRKTKKQNEIICLKQKND
jgi:hypothetical protein